MRRNLLMTFFIIYTILLVLLSHCDRGILVFPVEIIITIFRLLTVFQWCILFLIVSIIFTEKYNEV